MKKLFAAFAVGGLFCLASVAALAQNPLITVDENGNGTIEFMIGNPGVVTPMPGVLAPDPGPGGLASALTYVIKDGMGLSPTLTAGDLFITEPGNSNIISDIIRFNPTGTGGGSYLASLVFYSLPGGMALADTGFPTMNYMNTFSVPEGVNGFVSYSPGMGQPGFISGMGVVTTYNITSSPAAGPVTATPEFGSVFSLGGLLVAGGAGLWVRRRRSARAIVKA